jgi:phospholipid/cholesterol/gamma-HCH transport system permease protein
MANLKSTYQKPMESLDTLGGQLSFHIGVLKAAPRSVTRYPKEILRILAEVTLGSGALAVIGGTVGVIIGMTFFTGAQVGLSGYAALNQLGAMRISEEVDALEVMAIPSMPFLVATRVIGGLIAIVPLYVVGLLSSYFASRLVVTQFYGQSSGTYDYYFNAFLPPGDVLWSFGKVLVFSVTVILIHCYHGYTATGGPAGVGVAVGRAVRTSIVAINVLDLFLSMAIWGASTTVRLAG